MVFLKIASLAAFFCFAVTAEAANLLVRTAPHTTTGEPAGQVLQIVSTSISRAVPGAIQLPGASVLHPLRSMPDSPYAVVALREFGSGYRGRGPAFDTVALIRKSPLELVSIITPPHADEIAIAEIYSEAGAEEGTITVFNRPRLGTAQKMGRATTYSWADTRGSLSDSPSSEIELPGTPRASIYTRTGASIVVLCESTTDQGSVSLLGVDAATGNLVQGPSTLDHPGAKFGAHPVAIAATETSLFAMTVGYDADGPPGPLRTWIHHLSAKNFAQLSDPLPIIGTPALGSQSLALAPDGLWVVTLAQGADFAYATRIALDDAALTTADHIPFSGVLNPLRIAPAPRGRFIAIAADKRLEIWGDGRRTEIPPRIFDAPVETILWTTQGLFCGEGGRVHELVPRTLQSKSVTQLQTGRIREILTLPRQIVGGPDADGLALAREQELGTAPNAPDTDRDGIPDGIDPEPTIASPQLILPHALTFRGGSAGHEVLALNINHSPKSELTVHYDKEKMPWLSVDTDADPAGPSNIRLSIDPVVYAALEPRWLNGTVTVQLTGASNTVPAAGSPANIAIRVTPPHARARQILWLREIQDSGSSDPYQPLIDLLAAPPFHFSHRTATAPTGEPLDRYSLAIVELGAVAKGAITRSALLDYVVNGGSLLLLGEFYEPGLSSAVERWLEPVGIALRTNSRVHGRFAVTNKHEVTRHWRNFTLTNGCLIEADPGVETPVSTSGPRSGAAIALRGFGFGRIAVIASPAPLRNPAIHRPSNTRFAADLISWLTSTAYTVHDTDADGLPDYVEDPNGNLRRDANETGIFLPDTDRDGLPDGVEDRNRNGRVDESETDPRNPDSDKDGIYDGADAYPLPPIGTPKIARVEPATGPAEGGTYVEVEGINLSASATVWFGGRRAAGLRRIDSTRLAVIAPEAANRARPGTVPIRVVDPAQDTQAVLRNAFQYTPKSLVHFTLRSVGEVRRQYNGLSGTLRIALEAPSTRIGPIAFSMQTQPIGSVIKFTAETGPALRDAGRDLSLRRVGPAEYRITASPGRAITGAAHIGTLHWVSPLASTSDTIHFDILYPNIRAELAGAPTVNTTSIDVSLRQDTPP